LIYFRLNRKEIEDYLCLDQTSSFAQSFEQATGRPLQYLASVSNFAELASFSQLQSPLHMVRQASKLVETLIVSFGFYF
jgi:hypothetical protein